LLQKTLIYSRAWQNLRSWAQRSQRIFKIDTRGFRHTPGIPFRTFAKLRVYYQD
jgi:hypothetical protein